MQVTFTRQYRAEQATPENEELLAGWGIEIGINGVLPDTWVVIDEGMGVMVANYPTEVFVQQCQEVEA